MYPRFLLSFLMFICILPLSALAQDNAAYVEPVTKMEFVKVPAGSYLMGSDFDELAQPVHRVTLKSFLIGRYEVTFNQYALFCAATGRPLPNDSGWGMANRPVINVSWNDVVEFTKWLSAQSGRTFRLPSEAEWEYAARGGTTTIYPWGNEMWDSLANCSGCGSKWDDRSTAPVGSFRPNGYGLFDVIGNVYEWCLDRQHDRYHGAPTDGSPWLEESGRTERVYRGASFQQPLAETTVSRRCWGEPDERSSGIGFRVVLELKETERRGESDSGQ